ncbi:hypothetical protein [Nostoc sp.]|uniref:hypothetical protein n=1 Tax=Nostoc sp. TaxID=1180 RepID=UPI002FF50258
MQSSLANKQEFIIIDMGDKILLKPKKPFPETKLDNLLSLKTLAEYQNQIITLRDFLYLD